ncbi:sodium/hydrogen exchanger 9B2 isoform X3 [Prionailurus viverrinus]|uniref:sodium/hydrogen exchanger 9B2 isoform X3 n=1 Tax=Prionailurus viverrinus TaxID=61388 RepID=UPI001FF58278|nr:sodium/hydrogen exchanger 9B2 isoform X3 [Prionailurus viverrinus]
MGDEDKAIEHEDLTPSTGMAHTASTYQETQEEAVMNSKGIDAKEPTEGSNLLNSSEKKLQEIPTESNNLRRLGQTFACPPHGLLARGITNVTMVVLLWAVVWSITTSECLPGGNLFGIIILFYCAIIGGKLFGLIKLPTLPPLPPLLGPEEVEGCLYKTVHGSLSCGGMHICTSGPLSNGLTMAMGICPGEGGYGVEKGVPTLLMAAGSFDDILAITGFNTCLGMAFSTGSTIFNVLRGILEVVIGMATGSLLGFFIQYFPSSDQDKLVWKRAFIVLGLSILAVFSSVYFGFPGSGGLCTLVMSFLAGLRWAGEKADVEKIIAVAWYIFQPLLFGLIGAEVSIASLRPETVGLCIAILGTAVLIRVLTTFLMVCFAGFNIKEKIFISFAWLPKATVQAAIGSVALDTARSHGEKQLEEYGMDVLTVAFLSILITAPIGSLLIGLLGPRLLQKAEHQKKNEEVQEETSVQV